MEIVFNYFPKSSVGVTSGNNSCFSCAQYWISSISRPEKGKVWWKMHSFTFSLITGRLNRLSLVCFWFNHCLPPKLFIYHRVDKFVSPSPNQVYSTMLCPMRLAQKWLTWRPTSWTSPRLQLWSELSGMRRRMREARRKLVTRMSWNLMRKVSQCMQ